MLLFGSSRLQSEISAESERASDSPQHIIVGASSEQPTRLFRLPIHSDYATRLTFTMFSTDPLVARSFQSWLNSIIEQDDPRVGSGREGADGGSLSAANGSKGASLSKLGATFLPVSVYVAVCLIIFFIGRRRLHRVYAPRTFAALRAPE